MRPKTYIYQLIHWPTTFWRYDAHPCLFSELNRLVLDYLFNTRRLSDGRPNICRRSCEGFTVECDSAGEESVPDFECFVDFNPIQLDDANIEARVQIRNTAEQGDIQSAIEMCNDLDSEVCPAFLLSLPTIRSFMHHA
jgi:hypothetical protein